MPDRFEREPWVRERKEKEAGIDWLTILVGLLALIAVGGLIPFWMWVYFTINP
jgi:hypothetical protein